MSKIENRPYLVAKASDGQINIVNTPENIAAYIAGQQSDIQLYSPDHTLFLSSYGLFLDRCTDMTYYNRMLLPKIIEAQKMQTPPTIQLYQTKQKSIHR